MFARHGSECTRKKVYQGYENHKLKDVLSNEFIVKFQDKGYET